MRRIMNAAKVLKFILPLLRIYCRIHFAIESFVKIIWIVGIYWFYRDDDSRYIRLTLKTRIIVKRTHRKWEYKSRCEKKKKLNNIRRENAITIARVNNYKTETKKKRNSILIIFCYSMKWNPMCRQTQLPVVTLSPTDFSGQNTLAWLTIQTIKRPNFQYSFAYSQHPHELATYSSRSPDRVIPRDTRTFIIHEEDSDERET